jgi:hypothetical protein
MQDFDVVRPVKMVSEMFSLVLSGNPLICATLYRGLSQAWRRPFLSALMATYEFQSGEEKKNTKGIYLKI